MEELQKATKGKKERKTKTKKPKGECGSVEGQNRVYGNPKTRVSIILVPNGG